MLFGGYHENVHLQRAWSKHGATNFLFAVLLYCAPADLVFYEQRAIDYFKGVVGWRHMFNQNPKADSPLGRRTRSAESRAKLSARMMGNSYTLGHKLSAEHKAKIGIATRRRNLGSKLSQETKDKIGAANRGKRRTPEQAERARAQLRKLSADPEIRKIRSERAKARHANGSLGIGGRHHTSESKAKISAANRNKVFDAEYRRRISEGVKRSWQRRKQNEV